MNTSERQFMEQAVREAKKSVSEDARLHPKVGVVIVINGNVRITGFRGHPEPGNHAEFGALAQIPEEEDLTGATVFTTLEPCTKRHGENLPCADWLIRRRVKRVVIGILDPNPDIFATSYQKLRGANIGVQLFDDDLVLEIEDMNREWIREQGGKLTSPVTAGEIFLQCVEITGGEGDVGPGGNTEIKGGKCQGITMVGGAITGGRGGAGGGKDGDVIIRGGDG